MHRPLLLLLCAVAIAAAAQAPQPDPPFPAARSAQANSPFPAAEPAGHDGSSEGGGALPSMQFASTIAGDEIYDTLKQSPLFQSLDKDKPGSPVTILVSHIYQHTGGVASVATAIFTIGSLGLLPAVTNRDLVIKYEVIVHGSTLARYTYSKNLTHMFSVYAKDTTHGLGNEGIAWVRGPRASSPRRSRATPGSFSWRTSTIITSGRIGNDHRPRDRVSVTARPPAGSRPCAREGLKRHKKSPRRFPYGGFVVKSLAVTYFRIDKANTSIGAERFHFRVRKGIGWFPLAMAARQTVCDGRVMARPPRIRAICFDLCRKSSQYPITICHVRDKSLGCYMVKPHGQLVLVS